jgi:hypothetical protein
MANGDESGGMGLIGGLIGAFLVIALIYFFFGDRLGLSRGPDVNVQVEAPKTPAPPPVTPKSN